MSSRVKEAIEEMIEESYLLGLSKQEIRKDFKRFIDACYTVIQENVKDRTIVSGLAENLAREQTVILIADRAEASAADAPVGDLDESAADEDTAEVDRNRAAPQEFSEKVARRKRQILRTIAKYDPQLVRLIDAHRFQGEGDEPSRPAFTRPRRSWRSRARRVEWSQVRLQLLKVGYATTIVLIIALIWLGFTQNPF
jgi:hypothetical protein